MSRKKGSKNSVSLPTSYDIGDGATNFYLAILRQAKADEASMWHDFQKTELYKKGLKGVSDGLELAWWICRWLSEDK